MSKKNRVKAKKSFGQHFLNNQIIACDIVDSIQNTEVDNIVEVGPGMGVLTQFILKHKVNSTFVEVDRESVEYLHNHFPEIGDRLINKDFLKLDLSIFGDKIAIIGNFPYNISSQILFKVLDHKDSVVELVGMFQKELADRLVSKPNSKSYGIISVFLQAYYNLEYLFTLNPEEFSPPPKVYSSVVRMVRNDVEKIDCNEKLFGRVVHVTFSQRRKMIRNTLKVFDLNDDFSSEYLTKRPEQLSVDDFIKLTNQIEQNLLSS